MVRVVRKRASTLGWSVMAPDRILPPVLNPPMSEIRRADWSSVRPRCCVIWGEDIWICVVFWGQDILWPVPDQITQLG